MADGILQACKLVAKHINVIRDLRRKLIKLQVVELGVNKLVQQQARESAKKHWNVAMEGFLNFKKELEQIQSKSKDKTSKEMNSKCGVVYDASKYRLYDIKEEIECKYCNEHFDDIDLYKNHLSQHKNKEISKEANLLNNENSNAVHTLVLDIEIDQITVRGNEEIQTDEKRETEQNTEDEKEDVECHALMDFGASSDHISLHVKSPNTGISTAFVEDVEIDQVSQNQNEEFLKDANQLNNKNSTAVRTLVQDIEIDRVTERINEEIPTDQQRKMEQNKKDENEDVECHALKDSDALSDPVLVHGKSPNSGISTVIPTLAQEAEIEEVMETENLEILEDDITSPTKQKTDDVNVQIIYDTIIDNQCNRPSDLFEASTNQYSFGMTTRSQSNKSMSIQNKSQSKNTKSPKRKQKNRKNVASKLNKSQTVAARQQNSTLHQCNICCKTFSQKQNLSRHLATHSEQFSCKYCEHRNVDKSQLKKHISEKHNVQTFECDLCGYWTVRFTHLKDHILNTHIGYKAYGCVECNRFFAKLSTLKRHQLIHSGEKPFECSICDQKFRLKHHLVNHQQAHSSEKPFECNFPSCKFSSNWKSSLTRHMVKHTNVKMNKSKVWTKECTSKTALLKPIRKTHKRTDVFNCDSCDYSASRAFGLKRHKSVHQNTKLFACKICSKTYKRQSNFNKHSLTH